MDANTKSFVVDSSVIIALLMPDEKKSLTAQKFTRLLSSKVVLIAPTLLEFEIGNSLKSAVLSNRITVDQAKSLLDIFNDLPINFVQIKRDSVLQKALKNKLSFYDASYLYLAKLNKCKLLTLDKKLARLS